MSKKGNNQAGATSEWDEVTKEYRMPDMGLIYHAPNLQNLIIASPDQLEGGMIMCMIDTVLQECVSVVALSYQSQNNYEDSEIRNYVKKIVEQNSLINYNIINT